MRDSPSSTNLFAEKGMTMLSILFIGTGTETNWPQTRTFKCQIVIAIIRVHENVSHAFSRPASLKKDRLIAIVSCQTDEEVIPFLHLSKIFTRYGVQDCSEISFRWCRRCKIRNNLRLISNHGEKGYHEWVVSSLLSY